MGAGWDGVSVIIRREGKGLVDGFKGIWYAMSWQLMLCFRRRWRKGMMKSVAELSRGGIARLS